MKKAIILLAMLAGMHIAGAQPCLPEGIFFSTQQQINAFRTNYPGCTQILGDVTFSGFNIVSLEPLRDIVSIGGSLNIECNEILESLEGLRNLASVGGNLYLAGNLSLAGLSGLGNLTNLGMDLQCTNNPALVNLAGLEGIMHIPGKLWIDDNDGLVSLEGLDSLVTVGSCVRIFSNDLLATLHGLENLQSVGFNLAIGGLGHLGSLGNPSLVSLAALGNLTTVGGFVEVSYNDALPTLAGLDNIAAGSITELRITYNDTLSECEVASICDFLAGPSAVLDIHDNAVGCNSLAEVTEACLLVSGGEKEILPDVSVWPNPAGHKVSVTVPQEFAGGRITILDPLGRVWRQVSAEQSVTEVDLSGFKPGCYSLRISSGKAGIVKPLVVVKQ